MLATTHEIVGGKRLRVARLGDGTPILLLHGYPDTLQIWSNLAPLLAARFQVIAFDWPGMGESEAWSGGATPYDLARRVVTLLDHWNFGRAIVAAHDMGGQAALALAALAPERVERLVVINSLVIPDAPTSWEIRLLRRFRINQWLLRHMPHMVFNHAVATSMNVPLPLEMAEELWSQFRKRETREFVVRMCAGYEGTLHRLAASYPSITVPTRILWAANDRHFPPHHGRALHERLPNSDLHIIDGAEHWMVLTHAAEVADLIAAQR
jgi:pimeloyl-ACP methyl ester carboxylesterase